MQPHHIIRTLFIVLNRQDFNPAIEGIKKIFRRQKVNIKVKKKIEKYTVLSSKVVDISLLDKDLLFSIYKDSFGSECVLDDAIKHLAQCIFDKQPFGGIVKFKKNNGIFDWTIKESEISIK